VKRPEPVDDIEALLAEVTSMLDAPRVSRLRAREAVDRLFAHPWDDEPTFDLVEMEFVFDERDPDRLPVWNECGQRADDLSDHPRREEITAWLTERAAHATLYSTDDEVESRTSFGWGTSNAAGWFLTTVPRTINNLETIAWCWEHGFPVPAESVVPPVVRVSVGGRIYRLGNFTPEDRERLLAGETIDAVATSTGRSRLVKGAHAIPAP
jgi:hypothetical protein